jgi:hypothetical protein
MDTKLKAIVILFDLVDKLATELEAVVRDQQSGVNPTTPKNLAYIQSLIAQAKEVTNMKT